MWHFDPSRSIGEPGGFGQVFVGRSDQSDKPVAIKRLHVSAGEAAHRELDIASDLMGKSFMNVMEVLDAGQDADTEQYYVVMPLAEKSLDEEIREKGKFSEKDAVKILVEILNGLDEVEHIIHRDLKPKNILFHDNRWKIGDFGIAKFVEESTSQNTLKDCLSPQYAAPEQWRFETATRATDIYALGCIAHALLTGSPPFSGPKRDDFQRQHLKDSPPPLENLNPRLRSLISRILRKPANTRPDIQRVRETLEILIRQSNESPRSIVEGFESLALAGAKAAEEDAKKEALKAKREERLRQREELRQAGMEIFDALMKEFIEKLIEAAPNVIVQGHKPWRINLEKATMEIFLLQNGDLLSENLFAGLHCDVIAGIGVMVSQPPPSDYIWGANLLYSDLGNIGHYRWWEVCFMQILANKPRFSEFSPFAIGDMHLVVNTDILEVFGLQLAAKPKLADDENIEEFCERWANLLARAYNGKLARPRYLPMD